MTDVIAVLVVPAAGDPGGLMVGGLCSGSPPVCTVTDHGTWGTGPGPKYANALPLWWNGSLVPEGWDRARRTGEADLDRRGVFGRKVWAEFECQIRDAMDRSHPRLDQVADAAQALVCAGLAARVVCLARVDGALVEVP